MMENKEIYKNWNFKKTEEKDKIFGTKTYRQEIEQVFVHSRRNTSREDAKNRTLPSATLVHESNPNNVVFEYESKLCTAIFNVFAGNYYIDDTYGIIATAPHKMP